jgi:hypothetical protein
MTLFGCKDGPSSKEKLKGNVNIKGTMKVDETAEVEVTGHNGAANGWSYQWRRINNENTVFEIQDETGKTYVITDKDVGFKLSALVSNSATTGDINGISSAAVVLSDEKNEEITAGGEKVAVNGRLSRANMDIAKSKLIAAINGVLAGDDIFTILDLESILFIGLTINLENDALYDKYKVEVFGNEINLNADHVLSALASDLIATITAAVKGIYGSGPVQAKAVPGRNTTYTTSVGANQQNLKPTTNHIESNILYYSIYYT